MRSRVSLVGVLQACLCILLAVEVSHAKSISIETPTLKFELASANDGLGLLALHHHDGVSQFLQTPGNAGDALIWKLEITDDTGEPDRLITIDNTSPAKERLIRRYSDRVELVWRGVLIPGEAHAIDVTVTCLMQGTSGFSEWKISAENRSRTFSIWRIIFPVIELGVIGETGADDTIIMAPAEGRSVRDPIYGDSESRRESVNRDITTDGVAVEMKSQITEYGFGAARPHGLPYPSGRGQMQLTAYYEKTGNFYYPSAKPGAGLYLATHDSKPYPKLFFYTPDSQRGALVYEVAHFPQEQGQVGLGYQQPYPMVIGGFNGDWYDACSIYRQWVVEAPWMRLGPLAHRSDVPEWLKNMTVVARADVRKGDNALVVPWALLAAERLSGPIGIQWYNWASREKEADAGGYAFPPVATAPEGFAGLVDELQANDLYVFPYLNTRLWETKWPEYSTEVKPFIQRHANGELNEVAFTKQRAGHVCLQTDFWSDYVARIGRETVEAFHTKGLYLDQAGGTHIGGAFKYNGCFDPTHGHPLGATGDLVQAEHQRLVELLEAARTADSEVVMTGEGSAENFIDVLANKLIHYEIWPGYVPLFSAVYHDYITFYGRTVSLVHHKDPADPIPAMQIGWQLVCGNQIGRLWLTSMREQVRTRPEAQRHLAYLARAADLKARKPEFLNYGQMLRPPLIDQELPNVTTHQFSRLDNRVTLPSVLASTWQTTDGRVGVVLTNISSETVVVRFGLNRAELPAGLAEGKLTQVYPVQRAYENIEDQAQVSVDVQILPLDVRFFELQ